MREKSDVNKVLDGRCQSKNGEYTGFKKANESHSRGTASQIYDPKAGRIVDTLSEGETALFWQLRYDEHVVEIREQMLMLPSLLRELATEYGLRYPYKMLTTDFLVSYDDGRIVAYSVKYSRKELERKSYSSDRKYRNMLERNMLEKLHWEALGAEYQMVFSEEINKYRSVNIESCMRCYLPENVITLDHEYRYLIAHKYIEVDMDQDFIPFAKIASQYADEIHAMYLKYSGTAGGTDELSRY